MSHLLPRALYKRVRDETRANPNPVLLSSQSESTTSRQVQRPLLCSKCEDRFNKNGENWILDHLGGEGRSFKLREILIKYEPILVVADLWRFPCVGIPEVRTGALCYFALSVIWRTSVCDWKFDSDIRRLPLSECHLEDLRRFLLGDSHCPESVGVIVIVSSDDEHSRSYILPQSSREGCYFFTIPGLDFRVFIGDELNGLRDLCLNLGPESRFSIQTSLLRQIGTI